MSGANDFYPLRQHKDRPLKRFRGTIDRWAKNYVGKGYYISGVIIPEENEERFLQGFTPGRRTHITTSMVVNLAKDESQCETLNSIYKLKDKRGV